MEAIYDGVPIRTGFASFAPIVPARGHLFGSRGRLRRDGDAPAPIVAEENAR